MIKKKKRLELKEKKLQQIVARKYRTYNKGTNSLKKSKNNIKLDKNVTDKILNFIDKKVNKLRGLTLTA